MNYFGGTFEHVFNEVPYQVIIMLTASIPKYVDTEEEEEEKPKDLFSLLSMAPKPEKNGN